MKRGPRQLCQLDAFDFFILVFVLSDIAANFHTEVSDVSIAIMLTLIVRPWAHCCLVVWRKNMGEGQY